MLIPRLIALDIDIFSPVRFDRALQARSRSRQSFSLDTKVLSFITLPFQKASRGG